jgi:hypothetical protein
VTVSLTPREISAVMAAITARLVDLENNRSKVEGLVAMEEEEPFGGGVETRLKADLAKIDEDRQILHRVLGQLRPADTAGAQ